MDNFNELTAAEAERLALLLEELGEAQQAIGKILRHGYGSCHPDTDVSNDYALEKELGDVLAAMDLMYNAGDISSHSIQSEKCAKLKRVYLYLHHQREKAE